MRKRRGYFPLAMAAGLALVSLAGDIQYSYDDSDHLKEVLCQTSQAKVTWKYDEAHNVVEHKVFTDTDGDGIADYWELLYFGDLTTCNGTSDFDGDGLSDYAEYIAGTDPTVAESSFGFQSPLAQGTSETSCVFVVRWASQTNRLYTVSCSTNLLVGFDAILATNVAATPPVNEYVHTNGAVSGFYRTSIEEGN